MAEYIERESVRSKAVYMHGFGKNKYVPLRAIEEAPAADVVPRELLTASEVARADLGQRLAAEMQKCAQINEGAVILTKKLNDTLEELARYKDVAPVVRCRWCKSHHWEQEPCHGKTVHFCEKLNAEVTADFFCAAGKRKDGEG